MSNGSYKSEAAARGQGTRAIAKSWGDIRPASDQFVLYRTEFGWGFVIVGSVIHKELEESAKSGPLGCLGEIDLINGMGIKVLQKLRPEPVR